MDRIKDSGSFDQGSIPCGFTNIRLKLLIINLGRFILRNLLKKATCKQIDRRLLLHW